MKKIEIKIKKPTLGNPTNTLICLGGKESSKEALTQLEKSIKTSTTRLLRFGKKDKFRVNGQLKEGREKGEERREQSTCVRIE